MNFNLHPAVCPASCCFTGWSWKCLFCCCVFFFQSSDDKNISWESFEAIFHGLKKTEKHGGLRRQDVDVNDENLLIVIPLSCFFLNNPNNRWQDWQPVSGCHFLKCFFFTPDGVRCWEEWETKLSAEGELLNSMLIPQCHYVRKGRVCVCAMLTHLLICPCKHPKPR